MNGFGLQFLSVSPLNNQAPALNGLGLRWVVPALAAREATGTTAPAGADAPAVAACGGTALDS